MKCIDCGQEMIGAHSCTLKFIVIGGVKYLRDTTYYGTSKRCHDCGIVNKPGLIHHFGCDMERCPKCHGQLASCSCKVEGTTDDG